MGERNELGEVDGFCRIDRFSWEAFNESTDVKLQVENFKKLYGRYPLYFSGDEIYLTRENRRYLKKNGIKIVGKPLVRRPSGKNALTGSQKRYKKKKAAQRNHVEGKFGQAKRAYGMNNIKARLEATSESWVNAIFFVMNLAKSFKLVQNQLKQSLYSFFLLNIWMLKVCRFNLLMHNLVMRP